MSRSELAAAVSRWLSRETGKRHDLDPHLVAKWERGAVRRPSAHYRAALRAVLGVATDAELGFAEPAPVAADFPEPSEPMAALAESGLATADSEYVASLRDAVTQFVRMDSLLGSGEVVDAVVRRFRDAQQVLSGGQYLARVERDLEAATAELGELAGWMLLDSERHEEARRINADALVLARIAGDTSMERFILSNQALASLYSGRPRESLRISQRFTEDSRSPARVRALFQVRCARALGRLRDETGAVDAFDRARVLFDDGVSDRDPTWAWWFDVRELAGHAGSMYAELGRHGAAIPLLREAIDTACGRDELRWALYIHRAVLLDSALAAGEVAEAERVALDVAPMLGQMSSPRTERRLRAAVARGSASTRSSTLSDVVEHLRRRLPAR